MAMLNRYAQTKAAAFGGKLITHTCTQHTHSHVIMSGCVAFAKLSGTTRVEGELLPQMWEQVGHRRTTQAHHNNDGDMFSLHCRSLTSILKDVSLWLSHVEC